MHLFLEQPRLYLRANVPLSYDAKVERRHLETAIDESIKALTIAGSADGAPPPTCDDLQVSKCNFVLGAG